MEEMPQDCLEQSRPPHPCGLATQGAVAESFAHWVPKRELVNQRNLKPVFIGVGRECKLRLRWRRQSLHSSLKKASRGLSNWRLGNQW